MHRQSKFRLLIRKYLSYLVELFKMFFFMLRTSIASITLASLATLSPLNAEDKTRGFYFTGSAGLGEMSDIDVQPSDGSGSYEFESGFSGEIGIGYDFGSFRTAITFSETNTDLRSINNVGSDIGVNISTFLFSAAYDFRSDKKWQPYLSAGVGSSTLYFNPHNGSSNSYGGVNVTKDDDSVTTARITGGLNYEASENIDIYGEFWGQSFSDFNIGTLTLKSGTMTGASLGIRYKL